MDRLAREGTEYLGVEPAYPARTVVCFSSMLTGAAPPSTACARTSRRAWACGSSRSSTCSSAHGRRGPARGDRPPARPLRRGGGALGHLGAADLGDRPLALRARRAVVEEEDPDLLVLQLLAADQLGHVRGVRNPEYLDQLAETDRHVGEFLAFLEERGKLEGATVILMADHGQGRGIGGHGHLDWGERPVPFVVWGRGAEPGASPREPRSVCELAVTIAELLGVPAPAAARGRPLLPVRARPRAAWSPAPRRRRAASRSSWRATRRAVVGDVLGGLPRGPAGCRSTCCSWTTARATAPPIGPRHGARVLSTRARAASAPRSAPASSSRATRATPPPSTSTATASTTRRLRHRARAGRPRPGRLRARLALPRPPRGHELAPDARQPRDERAGRHPDGDRHERRPDRLPRLLRARSRAPPGSATTTTTRRCSPSRCGAPGIDAVEVPIGYRRRATGRSFVRYPEYLARVAPAIWREWRVSRRTRAASASADRRREPVRPAAARREQREQLGERAERRVGAVGHERAGAARDVHVEPHRRRRGERGERQPDRGGAAGPRPRAGSRAAAPASRCAGREPEAEHRGREEGGHEQLGDRARRRTARR